MIQCNFQELLLTILILTKLSSLWWSMATRLKEILWRSVVCRMPVVSVIRYHVSCTFAMVEPFLMRTVFTMVLWAFGFDSYQTQLTLMGHGYSIERDTVEECSVWNASCECYTVWCVLYICPGWALPDENSFHDGLMSFWLWFLPNSAHSAGPWLLDWKRYCGGV